jgi:putative flippase GtrA
MDLGAPGGLFVALAGIVLLPRRPVGAAVLEVGALLGWVFGAPALGPRLLVALGGVSLSALYSVRAWRGRQSVLDARIWGVAVGFLAASAVGWLDIPGGAAAITWLLSSGWLCSVALGLFTEGFAPRIRARSPTSLRQRALGRGGVARPAISAACATLADFLVFHSLLGHLAPGLATLAGCVVGGALNFAINRRWAFDSRGTLTESAVRYLWVSAASGLLNSAAVSLALLEPAVSPIGAWLVARALSFLGWNYPMQRDHVFEHRTP